MLEKSLFGCISIFFTLLAGILYVRSVLNGKTKPHVFTWILWALLTAIAAVAQYLSNAGPGAWAAGVSSIFCVITAGLAFVYGEREITRGDWITFLIGLSALPIWYFTSSPLLAVLLATTIDAMGYYPTLRKSCTKPHQEIAITYVISNIKYLTSILAMSEYSLTNLINPMVLFGMNGLLIGVIIAKRLQIRVTRSIRYGLPEVGSTLLNPHASVPHKS